MRGSPSLAPVRRRLAAGGAVRWLRPTSVLLALVLVVAALGLDAGASMADDPCPEPNDNPEQACDLKADQEVSGDMPSPADADRYRIDVADGQSVQVTLNAKVGVQKLRLEGEGGLNVAEVGLAPGKREVMAERLPAGRYFIYISGEGGDPGTNRPYTIGWRVVGSGAAVPAGSTHGSVRDLALTPGDVGEKAVQTGGRSLVTDAGRVYEAIYERENTIVARKAGPMYLVNRVVVADSAEQAKSTYDAWNVFDLPEANDSRPYESLGEQTMPGFGDASRSLGACYKCDDDNPLRSYRLVARFDTVVYMLYTWGRDAGANFNVVMDLANRFAKHLAASNEWRVTSSEASVSTRDSQLATHH